MKNTLILNGLDLVFGFTAPIAFALLVNEIQVKRFKVTVQTISYLPNFLSWIVVGGLFYQVLAPTRSGLVNRLLVDVFRMQPVQFLTDVSIFRGILVFADIWKNMGWSAILYFAALAGIDSSLYEAAYIDGAGKLKQTWHVTLPGIAPFISLMLLLKISSIFTIGFDRLYVLQNALVLSVADVISTYVYRVGLVNSQFSPTTAIGIVQSILGFTLLIVSNRASKKLTGMGFY
jgi:putative aldouronate transport system permease protein